MELKAAAEAWDASFSLVPSFISILISLWLAACAAAAAAFAYFEHRHAVKVSTVSARKSQSRAELTLRDSVLAHAREGIAIWTNGGGKPLCFAGASRFLESCLAGADGETFESALNALLTTGSGFHLTLCGRDSHRVSVRGQPISGAAVVYFLPEDHDAGTASDFKSIVDALPIPVWLRDGNLRLRWTNRAFIKATGLESLQTALEVGTAFDTSERDLAAAALDTGTLVQAKRYAMFDGARRPLALTLAPMPDGTVLGSAADLMQFEGNSPFHQLAYRDALHVLPSAIAIFGPDSRLAYYNTAYVKLWELSSGWLKSAPSHDEILDRLRERRKLPEQYDFAQWKRERSDAVQGSAGGHEELWHLPNGDTLKVTTRAARDGSFAIQFDNISASLALQAAYNQAVKVRNSILDALEESSAIFAPNGRLILFNARFIVQWGFDRDVLIRQPHIKELAGWCQFAVGGIWDAVTSSVGSESPNAQPAPFERSDGMLICLDFARLPDGTTLVKFQDVTNHYRFEAELRSNAFSIPSRKVAS